MSAESAFVDSLLRALTRTAARKAKPGIPSNTLRRAVRRVVIPGTGEGYLYIPHYWALYVHDGRGAPLVPRGSRFFVWWRNPRQDPRLPAGKTPERASQIRRLTSQEFKDALKTLREAKARGEDSPVIITRQVNKGTPPSRFFSNQDGMAGFTAMANREGMARFRAFLARWRGGFLFKTITDEVTILL